MKRLLLALLVTMVLCAALQENGNQPMEDRSDKHCTDLDSDPAINKITGIMAMMGTWHGIELINHDGREEGILQYRSCPVVHLAHVYKPEAGRKPPNKKIFGFIRYLELIVGEADHTLKFSLSYDSFRHCFWMCSEPQTGAMTRPELQYNQFTGVVQVAKATDSLLVLTFCDTTPGGQYFTVVLERAPPTGRVSEEVRSIPYLMGQYGVPIYSISKMCGTSHGLSNGTAGPAMGSNANAGLPAMGSRLLMLAAVLLVLMKNYY